MKLCEKSWFALLKDRQIFAWIMYDWANSAFSTVVISALLGPYFSKLIRNFQGKIFEGFFELEPDAFFPFCVSISVILQILFLPLIGAVADETSSLKKDLFIFFSVCGAIFTCFLGIVHGSLILLGSIFIISNFCFGASFALYNSFLPDISSIPLRDRVSSLGFSAGYLGGAIVLFICMLFFYIFNSSFWAYRASFIIAGLWWLLFTLLFPARNLRGYQKKKNICLKKNIVKSFLRIKLFFKKVIVTNSNALTFLIAYLFYNDGIQTVIVVASIFAVSELGISGSILLFLIFFIQIVALFGAIFWARVGEILGTKRAICLSLIIWILVILYGYLFLRDIFTLFVLGFWIALVLGGTQALSRSYFSILIPQENESQFFSIYEIGEKGSSWLGPFLFGLFVQFTGSSREAILSILIFFIIGFVLLMRVERED